MGWINESITCHILRSPPRWTTLHGELLFKSGRIHWLLPVVHDILVHILLWIQAMFGKLRPNLYLQMDNCWRENKNRFVLCFLALLIELGIFKKIKISCLMVGHNHEDIDQLFCISRRPAKVNVRTLLELIRETGNSFSPAIETEVIHNTMYISCMMWSNGWRGVLS